MAHIAKSNDTYNNLGLVTPLMSVAIVTSRQNRPTSAANIGARCAAPFPLRRGMAIFKYIPSTEVTRQEDTRLQAALKAKVMTIARESGDASAG